MDNNELLSALQVMFDKKVEEVKQHTGAIVENLKGDIKAIAEGHGILDRKIDGLDNKVDGLDRRIDGLDNKVEGLDRRIDGLDKKVDGLQVEISDLKKDMAIVKEYIIGVDIKLNEHETILKRVK